MKIQKGIVKYRDRNDIVCTYGITDDGVQYYFLDETDSKKLSNGNRIVTTALVEAIDPMAKCSNIGVIDNNGSVVIPCGNRSIKEINEELLLVETAQPTSLSVVEAINLKNDPLSAAKLVSTPAAIKDKINSYIGSEGKYLFNDQFSEATICDINGNNLLSGESYSFVVMANDKLYLSKNVPEEAIVEFDLKEKTIINNGMIDVSTAVVDQSVVEGALASEDAVSELESAPSVPEDVNVPSDLANAVDFTVPAADSITQDAVSTDAPADNQTIIPYDEENTTIDFGALDSVVGEETPIATDETSSDVPAIPENVVKLDEENPSVSENAISDDLKSFANGAPSDENSFVIPDDMDSMPMAADEQTDISSENAPSVPVSETSDEVVPSLDTELPLVEEVEENKTDENIPVVPALGEDPVNDDNPVEEVAFNDNVMSQDATPIKPDDVALAVDKDQNGVVDSDEYKTDRSLDDLKTDSVPSYDKKETANYDSYDLLSHGFMDYSNLTDTGSSLFPDTNYDKMSYTSYGIGVDNIMTDVVKSMSELMKQNKDQRALINRYREQMSAIESQSRLLADKYKDQSMRLESLTGRLRTMDEAASRLESKNQLLESRLRDQEKVIASQDRELKTLRPQLESKQDLVRLLADAQSLIGNDYSYEEDAKYYGRVA